MTSINAKTTNGAGPSTLPNRPPFNEISLNYDQRGKSAPLDPRILDDDAEYDEDAEPDGATAVTTGVYHVSGYNIKQMASALLFVCDPGTVYPLRSLNLPRAWIPYLHAVRVSLQRPRVSLRDYYPLPEQQKEFDEWETAHPHNVFPGRESFNLTSIPTFSEEEIPSTPLPYLIMAAITGSPSSTLTERKIKLALIRRFPYFAERLARNSRWQISVNWILSKYGCFESVPRKPTSEDDGCAYRVLEVSPFQTFISPARGSSKRSNPEEVTERVIPIYPFFPIDFGESIGELALKPRRPLRQRRPLSKSPLSLSTHIVDKEADANSSPSSSTASVSRDFWEANSPPTFDEEGPELRAETSSVSPEVDLSHLMIRPTGRLGEEYTLAPLLGEDHMEVESLPSLLDDVERLRRTWPDSENEEPPFVPPPPYDLAEPSLWTQCLLYETVKRGSDQSAKRKLARGISQKAHQFLLDKH